MKKFGRELIFRRSSLFRLCGIGIISVLIFFDASDSPAQWTKISTGAFPGLLPSGGMLHFKNGVLWGGYKSVSYSLDTGKTWTSSIASLQNLGEVVQNIDFIDDQNGLVRTNNYIYITTNRGKSWAMQTAPGGAGSRYTALAGSANTIISLASQGAYTSTNGGASWTQTYAGADPNIVSYRNAGVLAIFEYDHIIISTNAGQTWNAKPINNSLSDSYSFLWDPCDSNTLFLTNEDYFRRVEPWSEVFVTTDRGTTWSSKLKRPWGYFNGAMAVSQDAAYFQTVSNGIYRTADYGATWDSIAGPGNFPDTRWLISLSSNLLIGVDWNGDVWRTDNSGGFPVSIQSPVFAAPGIRSIISCQRDSSKFTSFSRHCRTYTITKASLSGPDTALFALHIPSYPDILPSGKRDTVKINFNPNHQTGIFIDTLHLSWLDDGGNPHDSVFTITENVGPAPIQYTLTPPMIVFDTVSPCGFGKDTVLTIKNTGCDTLAITAIGNQLGPIFSVDTMNLPIIVPPDSIATFRYHFHPSVPGFYNVLVQVTAEWKGLRTVQPMSLNGRETAFGYAAMSFDSLVNMDTVSACSPFTDTTATITNLACDTMRITSGPGKLGLSFDMDSVTYPFFILPGASMKFHFHFHPPTAGHYNVFAVFYIDWHGVAAQSVNFFLNGISSRSASGPLVSDTLINFHPVSTCNTFADTIIPLTNRSCDTMRIIGGSGMNDSNFSMDRIIFPIILPPDSSVNIIFHFHPISIGVYEAATSFITILEGASQITSLHLYGMNRKMPAPPAVAATAFGFDTVSTCMPIADTIITIVNRGCDTLQILSGPGNLGSGFSMDQITYPIILAPAGSATLHFYFHTPDIGNYSTLVHFLTERSGEADSIDFSLYGFALAGQSILRLINSNISFEPVSICSFDSTEIFYTNAGCDTLFVTPLGASGDADFIAATGSESIVLPGDTVHILIYFHPQQKGLRNGFYTLRYRDHFGVSHDTLLRVQGTVTDGTHIIAQSLQSIDFGTATLCAAPDSTITLFNKGCDTLEITGIGWQGSGFITDAVFPIILLPGRDTNIHIYSVLDTAGGKNNSSAQITFQSTSLIPLAPITLSRSYSYPKQYSFHFDIPNQRYNAGDSATIKIIADSLPSDLTTLEGKLSVQDTDMLTYLSHQSANSLSLHGDHLALQGNPITAPKGILAELKYKIYLTKDSTSNLSLSNIRFNGSDANYEKCIAFSPLSEENPILYTFSCGDHTIQNALNNNLAASLYGIYPNPAHGKISLDIETLREENLLVNIIDAKGSVVLRNTMPHPAGRSTISVNVAKLASGSYIVQISAGGVLLSEPLVIGK